MCDKIDLSKAKMTFDTFKNMANNKDLSKYEKIGFPDSYREGFEDIIFKNISNVLRLNREGITVFDIGCGCSDLSRIAIDNCVKYMQNIYMVDSQEMLSHLPDSKLVHKLPLKFPDEVNISKYINQVDSIIIYSVLQHIILDINPFHFIDKAVSLLKIGGRLLIGDIPNISKRNRFFSTKSGLSFHQKFMKTSTPPEYTFNTLIEDKVDDSLVFAILNRYRNAGYETYLLEQPSSLPMSNRREDILIVKD